MSSAAFEEVGLCPELIVAAESTYMRDGEVHNVRKKEEGWTVSNNVRDAEFFT